MPSAGALGVAFAAENLPSRMSTHGRAGSAGRAPNRLARESSPYLLQHAHNPVDWWAWGEEAFAEARRRDVPIFLSVGYSTCYWCHVMERESFEDEGLARLLNGSCVCVKVDREERPDVDEACMAALIITTGHGGWPMSIFLEPDTLRPFLCATYLSARPMAGLEGRPTFPQLIEAVSRAWRERRGDVLRGAGEIAGAVRAQMEAGAGAAEVGQAEVGDALSGLLRMHDRVHGGFGVAPKFPQPVFLEFLLDARGCVDESAREAIDAALKLTLNRMAVGGIFDHAAGGFHRYSVDATWTVPHFEKMLYDQAQMALAYGRAAGAFGDEFYARVARRTMDFVLGEMRLEGGGFAAAIDAEVDAREGLSYLWNEAQVREACGDEAEFALRVFGLHEGPNFRDPHHPQSPASSVLRLRDRPEGVAREMGMPVVEVEERIGRVGTRLLAERARRGQPSRDDKVIAAWNGLMIRALAHGSVALDEPRYLDAAMGAADFVLREMVSPENRLARSWREGRSGPPGVLEDYAHMIAACAGLARRGQGRFLEAAARLAARARVEFGGEDGSWFDSSQGTLFVRPRATHDGAMPSAGAAMMHALLDLAEAGGGAEHRVAAGGLLASRSRAIAESPVGCIEGTRGLLRLLLAGEVAHADRGRASRDEQAPSEFTPVEVYASADRVVLTGDEPATLTLALRMAAGYHVVAAEPGEGGASLHPLRVSITGGTGVAVYAEYPAGEELAPAGMAPVRVHHGSVEFDIALERAGPITGRPMILVSFQACSASECLRAQRVELDVAIDVGA